MKIAVFSDSHERTENMAEVLKNNIGSFDTIIHLGDFYRDMDKLKSEYPGKRFCCVTGNCDSNYDIPDEMVMTVSGRKVMLTHGHKYNVKFSFDRISYMAEEKEVAACLFGHTHQAVIFEYNGILFINPGSIRSSVNNDCPTYAVLDISDAGLIKPSIVEKRGGFYRVRTV